jgi:MFS family permease
MFSRRRHRLVEGGLGVLAQLTQGIIGLGLLLVGHQASFAVATSALAVSAFAVAMAVGRPLQGRALDAWPPRAVLAWCGVGHVAGYVLIAASAHAHWPAAFVACSLLAGVTLPPIATQMRAEWPDRSAAGPGVFAVIAMLQTVSVLVAPVLFAAVNSVASASVAMLTVAVVSGVCTVLFALVIPRSESAASVRRRVALRRYLAPLVVTLLFGAVDGTVQVYAPAVAIAAHHPGVAGPLVITATVGTLLGALYAMSPAGHRLGTRTMLLAAAVVQAVGAVVLLLPLPLVVAAAGLLTVGAGATPAIAALGVMVSERAGGTAEGFGWQSTALGLGVAAGSAVAGALAAAAAHLSAVPALVCALGCSLWILMLWPDYSPATASPSVRTS